MKPLQHLIRSSLRASLLLVLALVLTLSGCASIIKSIQGTDSAAESDTFSSLKDIKPTPQTMIGMARLLKAQGRLDESEQILARLTREYPSLVPVYNEWAEMMVSRRRFDAAIDLLGKGLEKAPEDPVLLNNIGMCHLMSGRYAEAESYFTRACAVRPQDARYRSNMALALGLSGRENEARSIYEQILPPEQVAHNMAIIKEALNGQTAAVDKASNKAATED